MRGIKIILVLSLAVLTAGYLITKQYIFNDEDIKVMDYKDIEDINIKNYEIEKYPDFNIIGWVNKNELLALTDPIPIEGCFNSKFYFYIYNFNTKEKKVFDNIPVSKFFGTSPNGKKILYSEPSYEPLDDEEYDKLFESGEVNHQPLKILDLESFETKDISTEIMNCSDFYGWISDEKILWIHENKWIIKDVNDNIYAQGIFNDNEITTGLYCIDELKDLGDHVEGSFSFLDTDNGNLSRVNVETNEVKFIYKASEFSELNSSRGYIVVKNDPEDLNGNKIKYNEKTKERRSSFSILDTEGKEIRKIYMTPGRGCHRVSVSPLADKVLYLEKEYRAIDEECSVDVLKSVDIKTGKITELASVDFTEGIEIEDYSNFDYFLSDFIYDSSGNSVILTYNLFQKEPFKQKWDSYVITFYG